ncbi:MAG: hypothetical protein ACYTHM_19060 [Planctomycetota bacterium]|jgi:hypothetical protein
MGRGDERYDTQEILAMNVDRLKQYMKSWDRKDGLMEDRSPEAVAAAKRRKRITQTIRLDRRPRVLLIRPDHGSLSRMIKENDRRFPNERFALTWGEDFESALAKMAETNYRAVIVFSGTEKRPDMECAISGLDFLLLLNGLLDRNDRDFLLKKRTFVKFLIPGPTDAEKIATFRLMKEDYRNRPFFFMHNPEEGRLAEIAERIWGVESLPLGEASFEDLFEALKKATF